MSSPSFSPLFQPRGPMARRACWMFGTACQATASFAIGWLSFALMGVSVGVSPVWAEERFNYDEDKVPMYRLPDPLMATDGTPVTSVEAWKQIRRPELLALFADQMFGRTPGGALPGQRFVITESDTPALNGIAIRRQIKAMLTGDDAGPTFEILLYLPKAGAEGQAQPPVPCFVGLNFQGNHTVHADSAIRIPTSWVHNRAEQGITNNRASDRQRGIDAESWQVELLVSRGYGLATVYYGDIDPDFDDGFQNGIHPSFFSDGQTKPGPGEWGSIGAWAWGLSRIADYLATCPEVDATKLAVIGHSRLGKTALWAGAQDERFGLVISNNSGCGGAALSRRRFGETVNRINTSFPHWFCDHFTQYNGKEDALPIDQHELIALIAPRPVYVASAEEDRWADPYGEYLSTYHAQPVYQLFGLGGLGLPAGQKPAVNEPLKTGSVGYHLRSGPHAVLKYDWEQYLDFADRHWGSGSSR
jgi:hypothetical protein